MRALAAAMQAMRPGWWLCIWAHFVLGAIMAAGRDVLGLPTDKALRALAAGGLWAMCLGGSAAALAVWFKRATPEADPESGDLAGQPQLLGWIGLGLMLMGLALSPVLSWRYFDAYLVGVILVALYVAPPIRLSRWPLTAAIVEGVGGGMLTLYAGYAVIAPPVMPGRAWLVTFLGFGLLAAAVRVLFHPTWRTLLPVLYVAMLVEAFACLRLGWVLRGRSSGVGLMFLLFLGWCALGAKRYFARPMDPDAPRPPVPPWAVGLLCLITDGAVMLSVVAN